MSFVILRHAKIKSSARGAVISHNHRLSDAVEKINIDPEKGHLNRSLMGQGAMQRLNEKLPSKMRKDAVIAIETLITASPEFFDAIEKDRSKLSENPKFKKWVVDSQIWMKKEWGDNVIDAVLHMDESSPHIHFLTVPLMKDGRLCAKDFLALGVMQRHQTEYAAAMESHGLERGLSVKETKRRHIGLKEAPAGSGGQASQLAAQLAATQAQLAKVQGRFDNLNRISMGDMKVIGELKQKAKEMDEYSKKLEADLIKKDEKIATELIAKAEVIEKLVQAGIKSDALLVTAEGHRAAAEKLTGKLAVSEEKVLTLTTENSELRQIKAQFAGYKQAAAAEAVRTAQEPPAQIVETRAPVVDQQALEEAFLAIYPTLQAVDVSKLDGMRLDAACGRLGVFSMPNAMRTGRVEMLCKVPTGKVMPGIGKCFDVRAVPEPGQQKSGTAR